MKDLLIIGDTHFGTHNNSLTWLDHQLDGFREIIDYIKTQKNLTVIHVGDFFDSRSSVNTMIYKRVSEVLCELNEVLVQTTSMMYILGGNHDYYYPRDTHSNTTGIAMLQPYSNIVTVVKDPLIIENIALIPWFWFNDFEKLSEIDLSMVRTIFTHTDPMRLDAQISSFTVQYQIVSGHIHQPTYGRNYLVTGACFPLDFNDVNDSRGFWTCTLQEDGCKDFQMHDLDNPIHFWRISEEDFLDIHNPEKFDIRKDDYVEVMCHMEWTINNKEAIEELQNFCTVSIVYIMESSTSVNESLRITNVDDLCNEVLEDNLKPYYLRMKEDIEKEPLL